MHENSRKISKLAAILLSLAADYFKSNSDFKPGIVTVTAVDVSVDKSQSIIWVSLINVDETVFTSKIGYLEKSLRKYISQHQQFRYTPNIRINIDKSAEEIQKNR